MPDLHETINQFLEGSIASIGRDPVIESKSITANGTYTAPEGVDGYSPITVNVPLPQNAYLLKSVPNLPQAIASFTGGADAPMKSLKVAIEPQQEGSGDPSPTNVRPISGWTEEVITVSDDTTSPTVEHTTTIPFTDSQGNPVEVYGGSVDVVNGGGQPQTLGEITLNGSENYTIKSEGTDKISFRRFESTAKANADGFQISNRLIYDRNAWRESAPEFSFVVGTNELFLTIPKSTASTVEELKTWIASNNIQIIYELATPTTFYTQPTAVKSVEGQNNVYANTGDIKDAKYFSKEV